MKKYNKKIVIIVLLIGLVLFAYFYNSNKNKGIDETEIRKEESGTEREVKSPKTKEDVNSDLNEDSEENPNFEIMGDTLVLRLELTEETSLEYIDLVSIVTYYEEYEDYEKRKLIVEVADFGIYEAIIEENKTSDDGFWSTHVFINEREVKTVKAKPIEMKLIGDILHVYYHSSFDLCCGQIMAYDKEGKILYNHENVADFYIMEIEVESNNDVMVTVGKTYHGFFHHTNHDICEREAWQKAGIKGSDAAVAVYKISYLGNYRFSIPEHQETKFTIEQIFEENDCEN